MNYPMGIPDDKFLQDDVQILNQEIRMLMIVKAQITSDDLVVDIGAGNGSLSVEAALQNPHGMVFTIEARPERLALLVTNAAKFGVNNIRPIPSNVCQGINIIPVADVILISDSRIDNLPEVLEKSGHLLRRDGRIVIAASSKKTVSVVLNIMDAKPDFIVEAFVAKVTPLKRVKDNGEQQKNACPVYIITCTKHCAEFWDNRVANINF